MTNFFAARRLVPFAVTAVVGVAVALAGMNLWLIAAIGGGMGVLWSVGEIVVDEVQGRKMQKQEEGHDE